MHSPRIRPRELGAPPLLADSLAGLTAQVLGGSARGLGAAEPPGGAGIAGAGAHLEPACMPAQLFVQVQRAIFIRDNAREGSVKLKVRLDPKTQKSRKKVQPFV